MAITNPSNLYTAGAVNINTQPQVNMYAQLMARKQAKEDALDQYYSKTLSDVTSAGMRQKDVLGGWGKKVNDWQAKYMNPEKRRFLANPKLDNYKTITEFNQEHQGLIQEADLSKTELKDEALLNQLRISGKWNPTDDDLKIAHRKGLSIYSPERKDEFGKDPDLSNLSFNVPEFTPLQEEQTYRASIQGVPKDVHYDENRIRKDATGFQYVPKLEAYTDPKKVEVIMDNYGNNLSKSGLVKYENLMHDPEMYQKATKAYQQIKGVNEIIDTPIKMAQGVAALRAMKDISEKEEKAPDWMLRTSIGQSHKQANIRLASALGLGSWKDKYQFNSDAITAGVDKNNITAQGLIDGAKQPDGTLKLDPEVLGLPNYAANLRVDGSDIKYDVTYEGGKKETKSITRESGQKYMANKLDLKVVPIPQHKPKQPTGGSHKKVYNQKTGKFE